MNNHDKQTRKELMIKDGLSQLDKSSLPTPLTDTELIMKKGHEICKAVAAVTRELDAAARTAGTPHDAKTLAHIVSKQFAEGFGALDKDELIFLITVIHTDIALDSLLGNTQGPKIISPYTN